MSTPSRREWFATVAALPFVPRLFRRDRVRFSNIEFETASDWTVAQPSPQMVLRPTNVLISRDVRITIDPAAPAPAGAEAAAEAAWTSALGTSRIVGTRAREDREAADGVPIATMSAATAPGGLVVVAVVSQGKLTRLVMSAATDAAYQTALPAFLLLAASIVVIDPALLITGSAGPEASFNWAGPAEFNRGIYDLSCRVPDHEFNEMINAAKGLAGAVRPRPTTFAEVQAFLKQMTAHPSSKPTYDRAVEVGSAGPATMFALGAADRLVNKDTSGAITFAAAGLDANPAHPGTLFNLAGLLAYAGLANESIAVLDKLEAGGRMPAVALGVKPEAAIAHTRGYAEMLRGNLTTAETLLTRARAQEPFLVESTHTLSVVKNALGKTNEARSTYATGMFRRSVKDVVDCQAGEQGPFLIPAAPGKEFREKTDETFDCSKGLIPNLVQVDHPGSLSDLRAIVEKLAPKLKSTVELAKALMEQSGALSQQLDHSIDGSPYDAWAEYVSEWIEGLEEQEPMLRAIERQQEAVRESAQDAVGRYGAAHLKRISDILMSGASDVCPLIHDSCNRGIAQSRPHVQALDYQIRRYAKTWYRVATGINAHIKHPKWHEMNSLAIRSKLIGFDAALMMLVLHMYGPFHFDGTCPPPGTASTPVDPTNQADPNCPEGLRGAGAKFTVKIPLPRFPLTLGVKVNCDKITLEGSIDFLGGPSNPFGGKVSNPVLQVQAGPFAQIELANKGKFSVFAGAREQVAVLGVGETMKQGVFISGDREGVNAAGFRMTGEASQGISHSDMGLSISSKTESASYEVSVLPSVPAPKRGPGLQLQAFGT